MISLSGRDITIRVCPAVFHCFILGIFAAFFAPFGGFFASGLKRALRIKVKKLLF
jgi:phosphatidate cytidylyltransferase